MIDREPRTPLLIKLSVPNLNLRGQRLGERSKWHGKNKTKAGGFSSQIQKAITSLSIIFIRAVITMTILSSNHKTLYIYIFLDELVSSWSYLSHSALSVMLVLIPILWRRFLKLWWKARFTSKDTCPAALQSLLKTFAINININLLSSDV